MTYSVRGLAVWGPRFPGSPASAVTHSAPIESTHAMPLPAPSLPLLALTLLLASLLRPRSHPSHTARECTLAPSQERVVVLGASSGVGEALALEYARRGARLCLVARRRAELERVREACEALYPTGARERHEVLVVAMDISSPEDLVKLREVVEEGGRPSEHSSMPRLIPCSSQRAAQPGPASTRSTSSLACPRHSGSWRSQRGRRRRAERRDPVPTT